MLKQYAQNFDAKLSAAGRSLPESPASIHEVERKYGVVAMDMADGDIDHTFLTSLIDPDGVLRVQYIGVRFDLEEFRRDIVSLVDEPK